MENSSHPGVFVFGSFLNHIFNFSTCDWSSHFSISSWFSLGRLYLCKNLSISYRLSILLAYSCLVVSYDPLYFYGVSFSFSFFISNFIDLSSLHFFLDELGQSFIKVVDLFKEPTFGFTDLLYCFLCLYFIYFCSDLYDFFPSANFKSCLFFSLKLL